MPSKFAQKLKSRNLRRDYLRYGRAVFEVQPIVSRDLWRVGFAHLEGSSAYAAEVKAAQQEMAALRQGLGAPGLSEEQKRRLQESIAELAKQQQQAERIRWLANEKSQAAYLERCDAYICAAVTGVGELDPDVEISDLVDVSETNEWDVEIEPVQFVSDERDADYDADRIHVRDLGEHARVALGSALIGLRSVEPHREVRPFRAGSGDSGAARPAGKTVREAPERDRETVPRGSGSVSSRDARRRARGSK